MILPRRLFLTADDKFCEIDDIRQVKNYHPAGYPIPDAEAERIGLKAYLDETGWGEKAQEKGEHKVTEAAHEKAIAQGEVEDKAVAGPEVKSPDATEESKGEDEPKADEGPGLHIDPAIRRSGRRGS